MKSHDFFFTKKDWCWDSRAVDVLSFDKFHRNKRWHKLSWRNYLPDTLCWRIGSELPKKGKLNANLAHHWQNFALHEEVKRRELERILTIIARNMGVHSVKLVLFYVAPLKPLKKCVLPCCSPIFSISHSVFARFSTAVNKALIKHKSYGKTPLLRGYSCGLGLTDSNLPRNAWLRNARCAGKVGHGHSVVLSLSLSLSFN